MSFNFKTQLLVIDST